MKKPIPAYGGISRPKRNFRRDKVRLGLAAATSFFKHYRKAVYNRGGKDVTDGKIEAHFRRLKGFGPEQDHCHKAPKSCERSAHSACSAVIAHLTLSR